MHRLRIIFILIVFSSCKPSKPFDSFKEKRNSITLIKKELNLSKTEYNLIKNNDSVLLNLAKSLNEKVKPERLKRRLDSFYQKKYTNEELLAMIKVEYIFRNDKNLDIEIDRENKFKESVSVDNVEDGKKFMDSLITNIMGFEKKVKDSLN